VALTLIDMGFTNVYALEGGWKEWEASGCPMEEKGPGESFVPGPRLSGEIPHHLKQPI